MKNRVWFSPRKLTHLHLPPEVESPKSQRTSYYRDPKGKESLFLPSIFFQELLNPMTHPWGWYIYLHMDPTVDGKNPAPPGMYKTL